MKQKLLFLLLFFCSITSLFSMNNKQNLSAKQSFLHAFWQKTVEESCFRTFVEKIKKTSGHKSRKPINEIALSASDLEYHDGCKKNHEAYKPSSLAQHRPEAISIEPQDPVL